MVAGGVRPGTAVGCVAGTEVSAGGAVGWDVGASSVLMLEHPAANDTTKTMIIVAILYFIHTLCGVEIGLSSAGSGVFQPQPCLYAAFARRSPLRDWNAPVSIFP